MGMPSKSELDRMRQKLEKVEPSRDCQRMLLRLIGLNMNSVSNSSFI